MPQLDTRQSGHAFPFESLKNSGSQMHWVRIGEKSVSEECA